jgi:hypothetical protein
MASHGMCMLDMAATPVLRFGLHKRENRENKSKMKSIIKFALATAAVAAMSVAANAAEQRFVSIGTGGVTGV